MLKKTAIFFVLVMLFLCAACTKEEVEAPISPTPESATIKPGDVEAFLRGENKELMEVLDAQQ